MDTSFGQVKALLFDVFGTVVDWREGIAEAARPLLGHIAPAVDAHMFADAWRGRYQPAMAQVRNGKRPFTRLDVLHRENLTETLRSFALDPDTVPAAEADELNLAWQRLDPWPDSVAGLTRLKSRFIIAPLSNANISLALNMAKRAGLPWDAILGAEVVRAYKPQPESYLATVDILGLTPAEVALVAAHNSDLAAAGDLGLRTVFVPRPTEHGPVQTTDLKPSEDWDIVAVDLIDLAERLEC